MLSKLFILLGLCLTVLACSKNEFGGGSGGTPGAQSYREEHKDSYQIIVGDCDTGKHEFQAPTADELKKQLCEALEDDELNNPCSRKTRSDYFAIKCTGLTWQPKPASVTSQTNSAPSNNFQQEDKLRRFLNFVLVDKYDLPDNLSVEDKKLATNLGEDLYSCGASYMGPKCLNYSPYNIQFSGSLVKVNNHSVVYSEMQFPGTASPLVFTFTVDALEPAIKVTHLEVAVALKSNSGQEVSAYLGNQNNFKPLLNARLVGNVTMEMKNRLDKPRDIKTLYHVSREWLGLSLDDHSEVAKKVAKSFEDNVDLIVKSDLPDYQAACLNLAFNQISVSAAGKKTLSEGLLSSTGDTVKQMAAVYLLDSDSSRTELKPLVIAALGSKNWDIRERAIIALNKTSGLSKSEENQILGMLNDSIEYVRDAAIEASSNFKVDVANLNTLENLTKSQYFASRMAVVDLLNLVPGPDASALMIGMMSDSIEYVRDEVFDQLNKRTLTTQDVAALAKQADSSIWSVRQNVATLLGKLPGDDVNEILINHMSDSIEYVRDEMVTQLTARTLGPNALQALAKQFSSAIWSVRESTAKLVATIQSQEATTLLIQHLADTIQYVRDEVFSQLGSKTLTKADVPALAKQFQSTDWTSREYVATLLGTIKDPSSLDALKAQLKVETIEYVKDEINASIAKIQ